ncbi:Transport and Golgi organization protein 6-like protein [Bienertia sinuspersici]
MAENSETQSSDSNISPPTPSEDDLKLPQVPNFPYFSPLQQHGSVNMLPIMYPTLLPGLASAQNPEQINRGPGIYAVPYMGTVTGIPTNNLIPLTYNTPTRTTSSEAGTASGEQSQTGLQQPQQQQQPQQIGAQRQIGPRRFQIAFQLDLLLIIKLAAVIFIFNQDGSRQRLALLVFFAFIVYLYQNGALTPLMRWISQAMHRAAAPPRPPRPAARVDPVVRQGDDNVAAAAPDAQPGAENNNPPADGAERVIENEAAPEAGIEGGNHWWGIVKEIQMIVFGFITSLLPGFHNMDHA